MIHAVFALVNDFDRCLEDLLRAGFRRDEIARLGGDMLSAAGRPFAGIIRGTLGAGVATMFTGIGLPGWAAQQYEDGICRGDAVVAVCTDNGWEVDTISDLLSDGGCQAVVACQRTPEQPPAASA